MPFILSSSHTIHSQPACTVGKMHTFWHIKNLQKWRQIKKNQLFWVQNFYKIWGFCYVPTIDNSSHNPTVACLDKKCTFQVYQEMFVNSWGIPTHSLWRLTGSAGRTVGRPIQSVIIVCSIWWPRSWPINHGNHVVGARFKWRQWPQNGE